MPEDGIEAYDLVIIGAGLYGIQAARTYLEVHPTHNVVILESVSTPGGVWSAERMYDAFWTQTPLGIAGFSDRPLEHVPETEQYYRFFAARNVTSYLEEYVDSHVYEGSSLRSRIVFNSTVELVTKLEGLWTVQVQGAEGGYKTPRLIVASGLTSTPNIPAISGLNDFAGQILHHKDVGKSDILSNCKINNIAVVGGAKSAADIAYAAAKAGKHVNWIIRKSGNGPAAFFSVKGPKPYRNSNESFYTRLTGYFIASIFALYPFWICWLYSTTFGRYVHSKFWSAVDRKCWKLADYDRADGQENGFYNLKPDTPVFWQNDSSSINQRPDFFDVIATKVMVHRQDVVSIDSSNAILLSNQKTVPADAIVFATGWGSGHTYFSAKTREEFGLPISKDLAGEHYLGRWTQLDKEQEKAVIHELPILSRPPSGFKSSQTELQNAAQFTPYRLYRSMLPLSDRSIVFVGHIMLGNHFRAAEAQALWAVAQFGNNIALPDENQMRKEIARVVAWCRHRYLQKGQSGNWFYYDLLPYTDLLLRDIGLGSHIQPGWRGLLAPAWAMDLKGLIQEYKSKYQINYNIAMSRQGSKSN